GPRTARAVEPFGLVQLEQSLGRTHQSHLLEGSFHRHGDAGDAGGSLLAISDLEVGLVVVGLQVALPHSLTSHHAQFCTAGTRGVRLPKPRSVPAPRSPFGRTLGGWDGRNRSVSRPLRRPPSVPTILCRNDIRCYGTSRLSGMRAMFWSRW